MEKLSQRTLSLNEETLHEAEKFLHERIPLTRAMGVRVLPDPGHGFAIEAPVRLNHNHLQTAFGGSINAICTLAGYTFLWLELRGDTGHVVISKSSIRFLKPIREEIRAVCDRTNRERLEAFHALYQTTGKASIQLQVRAVEKGVVVARFEAIFVALQAANRADTLREKPGP